MFTESVLGIIKICFSLSCILILNFNDVNCQLRIVNPSFEITDPDNGLPSGWQICANSARISLDDGNAQNQLKPDDGKYYLTFLPSVDGLKSTTYIKLSKAVLKDSCQNFSLSLAYNSELTNFSYPTKLRIYLSKDSCSKDQLIFESPYIKHQNWKKYNVRFTPGKEYQYLLFEAGFPDGIAPANSNLSMDNLSLLRQCPKRP